MPKFQYSDLVCDLLYDHVSSGKKSQTCDQVCDQILSRKKSGDQVCDFSAQNLVTDQVGVLEFGHLQVASCQVFLR